jgi:hypothetical protein
MAMLALTTAVLLLALATNGAQATTSDTFPLFVWGATRGAPLAGEQHDDAWTGAGRHAVVDTVASAAVVDHLFSSILSSSSSSSASSNKVNAETAANVEVAVVFVHPTLTTSSFTRRIPSAGNFHTKIPNQIYSRWRLG